MNRFKDGTWSFRAHVGSNPFNFEVTYRDTNNVGRRVLVGSKEEAQRLADAKGGKWNEIDRKGFKLQRAR